MPHKIVFLVGSLDRGGAEGQLVELATRLNKDLFAPEIWCLHHRGMIPVNGVPIRTYGYNNLPSFLRMLCILTLDLRRTNPRIVHGFLFESYIAAALCGFLAGVPVRIQSRRSLGIFKQHRKFALLVERLSTWFTHAIVANCYAVSFDTLRRELWVWKKLHIIYNGVDLEKFRPVRIIDDNWRKCPSVCLVANLIHYKRVDRFLKIAERIHDYLPEARFLILGGGPCEQDIKLSMPKSLAPFVTFAGGCGGIENILPYQDVCLLTSDQEGFPNAVLEAMACGVPVVASNVGGVSELIVHEKNGYKVRDLENIEDWVDYVLDILKWGKYTLIFSRDARLTAEQFSIQRMVSEYEKLYLGLLAK